MGRSVSLGSGRAAVERPTPTLPPESALERPLHHEPKLPLRNGERSRSGYTGRSSKNPPPAAMGRVGTDDSSD